MLSLDQITQLHIELTTKCNARCPMCPRNYRGMDFNSGYPKVELDLEQFRKIFKPAFLKQIKLITFNGNLGDASLARDLVPILNYIYESSESMVTIYTNASTHSAEWWANLAHPNCKIVFDLDGLEDTHNLYRLDTSWHKVIDNARAFINNNGWAIWQMIVFDHNRHQITKCRDMSKELGFQLFWPVDTGRNQGPVFDRRGNFTHWLGTPQEKKPLVHELINGHLTWFDSRPQSETHLQEKIAIDCQHKQRKELYVAADGSVYPCCFLGFYPGQMSHPGNKQLEKLVEKNNALEYDLEECIQWFNKVEESWKLESEAQGKLYTCITSCRVKQ
jgi:MoaA/NifB/PqqE/SkfB family radical SAM enzyme